ncbi:MAG: class I SAM-dependent methyltransferase [Verrucomicrobia bacterium]|nr:class I SAM-dependent methyltransferase [Verrucomicrobiota bacterium]
MKQYELIDSGNQQKLERFGDYLIVRPCSQALWRPALSAENWDRADALFTREKGNAWKFKKKLPKSWIAEIDGLEFQIAPTDFGHLGVFPEHSLLWREMEEAIRSCTVAPSVLNLFAYSGGATLAAARAGAKVCHLDASKGMVDWARQNAQLNGLEKAPIRWIVDDAIRFLKREVKRGVRYEGIILDPPSFGRGSKGEVFKIESDIHQILELCRSVLSDAPLFVLFTTHTPGMTPTVLSHLLEQFMPDGTIAAKELLLPAQKGLGIPYGCAAKWSPRR